MARPLAAPLLAALVGLVAGLPARAHDTWFAPRGAGASGESVLALATGNRFPVAETAVDFQYFAQHGCRGADGAARPIELQRYTERESLLRVRGVAPPMSCFVQIAPFDIELPPDKIELYFAEIKPSAAVLAAWATLKARGLPFRERYVKSARIDLGAQPAPSAPVGIAMDVLRLAPAGALAVGTEATFQVLREGRPLADFPVELVNERSALGLWQRTDAQGRVRIKLPLPGRWLLRGTDLRLAPGDPTRWDSRFVTYAFDVLRP